jgi:hypothetical protein
MDSLNLKLDHDNELLFKVMIEGSREADTLCRLMVERDEYSYAFPGEVQESGEVVVFIPALEKTMKEGTYDAKLEVIVDDRVFEPLKFHAEFTKSVKVTAESVTRRRGRKVSATAEIISSAPKISRVKRKAKPPVSESKKSSRRRKSSPDISNLSESQKRALLKKLRSQRK